MIMSTFYRLKITYSDSPNEQNGGPKSPKVEEISAILNLVSLLIMNNCYEHVTLSFIGEEILYSKW